MTILEALIKQASRYLASTPSEDRLVFVALRYQLHVETRNTTKLD